MKCRVDHRDSHMTPQEFEEAMEGIAAYRQFKQVKAKLRFVLDSLNDAQIRANIQEYEEHHTMGGIHVFQETYQLLNAELIHRGPCAALLNPNNCINERIL